jgi:hypothetical protein
LYNAAIRLPSGRFLDRQNESSSAETRNKIASGRTRKTGEPSRLGVSCRDVIESLAPEIAVRLGAG